MGQRARRQIMCEPFDKIAATPWVDDFGGLAFHLQQKLRVAGNARGKIGWQRQSLIETVRVQ